MKGGITLLHYYNETTDGEYVVLRADEDELSEEDYGEEGYKLLNRCELSDADISLPISVILSKAK